MQKTLLLITLLIILSIIPIKPQAQIKFDPTLLDNPRKYGNEIAEKLNTIELYEYSPDTANCIFLENDLRSSRFVNEDAWLKMSDSVNAFRIDIVYSKYPLRKGIYYEIYPLLFDRIRAIFKMDPSLNDEQLTWNKVLQTHCVNDRQVDSLFHGVVIWYRTEVEVESQRIQGEDPISKSEKINRVKEQLVSEQLSYEEIESNVEFMINSAVIPDSLRAYLNTQSLDLKIAHLKRFYEERMLTSEEVELSKIDSSTYNRFKSEIETFMARYQGVDPVVLRVLDRHPEWKNMLIVNDWTGSMYHYGAQVLQWHLLNFQTSGIQTITLFNDGNHKLSTEKEIGETEGIYTEKADNIPQVIDLFNYVMLQGGGGDSPENDIEAILSAIEENPQFSEVVLVADNNACVRDIELADLIGVPVRIILCGYSKNHGVNASYVHLAEITGGGIYTIDEDIERLILKRNNDDEIVGVEDDRIKLTSNKCDVKYFKKRDYVTTYTLKTGRYKKRKVRILDASSSELGKIPNWIFKCPRLRDLNLSHNELTELPQALGGLLYLSKLDISFNEIQELPKNFARIKYLTHLNASNNLLTEFPKEIKNLGHLVELDLSNNNIPKFKSLKSRHLRKVNLANNGIESVDGQFNRQRALVELNLSGNELTSLPTNLPYQWKLRKLNLSNNKITSLPSDLSALDRLEELDLSGNSLSEVDKNRLKAELVYTKIIF